MTYKTQEPPFQPEYLPEYLSRELRRIEVAFNDSVTPGADIKWIAGNGVPEGRIAAATGSLYSDTSVGSSTVLYVKESGNGTTGWVGK